MRVSYANMPKKVKRRRRHSNVRICCWEKWKFYFPSYDDEKLYKEENEICGWIIMLLNKSTAATEKMLRFHHIFPYIWLFWLVVRTLWTIKKVVKWFNHDGISFWLIILVNVHLLLKRIFLIEMENQSFQFISQFSYMDLMTNLGHMWMKWNSMNNQARKMKHSSRALSFCSCT